MSSDHIRAVRNNNPGNLERGAAWKGLATLPQMTEEQREELRFCVFASAAWGFRALAIVLMHKKQRGLDTVRKMITDYAPADENQTADYIAFVAHAVAVGADDVLRLDAQQLTALCRAIATDEAGGWKYQDADLALGVHWAMESAAVIA